MGIFQIFFFVIKLKSGGKWTKTMFFLIYIIDSFNKGSGNFIKKY